MVVYGRREAWVSNVGLGTDKMIPTPGSVVESCEWDQGLERMEVGLGQVRGGRTEKGAEEEV